MSEIYIPKVAILASGEGTTADAFANAIYEGQVRADLDLVISSRKEAGILNKVEEWNRNLGFATERMVINSITHPWGKVDRGQTFCESEAIAHVLEEREIGIVALLGYMRIVNGPLMDRFGFLPGVHKSMFDARMINSHPGPLPETADTYGELAAQRVIDLGLPQSKHTVHVVSPGVDRGPIYSEHPVERTPDESTSELSEKTQLVEKKHIAADIVGFAQARNEYLNGLALA